MADATGGIRVEHINPFVEGVFDLFNNMLSVPVKRGESSLADHEAKPEDLTGVIGLSGVARGTVTIFFPAETALSLVGQLLDREKNTVDDEVFDGVAEMVNMIAGGAKAKITLGEGQEPIELGLPTVIQGSRLRIEHPSGAQWVEIPFDSPNGPFFMRVAFDLAK